MPKSVKLIIAVVAVVFIASVAASVIIFRPKDQPDKDSGEPNYIEIVRDGKVI